MNHMYDSDEKRSLYNLSLLAQGTANGYLINNFARFPTYSIDFGAGHPRWCDYQAVAHSGQVEGPVRSKRKGRFGARGTGSERSDAGVELGVRSRFGG